MSLRVTLQSAWDAVAMQTVEFMPRGAHAVLLTFEADPEPEDAGLPPALAAALAAGLCACGIVAGRWFDAPPPPAPARLVPAPPLRHLQRVRDFLLFSEKTWPANLALTRDPNCAAAFFETGWSQQYQAILVLPVDAQSPCEAALAALHTTRDWRSFAHLAAVLAFCAPAVDGDAVLIASASAAGLSEVAATLETALQQL